MRLRSRDGLPSLAFRRRGHSKGRARGLRRIGERRPEPAPGAEGGGADARGPGLRLLRLGRLHDARLLFGAGPFLFGPGTGLLFTRKRDGIINLGLHLLKGRKQRTIGHKDFRIKEARPA